MRNSTGQFMIGHKPKHAGIYVRYEKKCEQCGKSFLCTGYQLRKKRFCSKSCAKIGNTYNIGRVYSDEAKIKMGLGKNGIKRLDLIGNDYAKHDVVTYSGLHHRMRNNFGTPNSCELCYSKTAKKYEWASIGHVYTENRADWIRVCTHCHREIDGISAKRQEETSV
jgi:hypothetical protein